MLPQALSVLVYFLKPSILTGYQKMHGEEKVVAHNFGLEIERRNKVVGKQPVLREAEQGGKGKQTCLWNKNQQCLDIENDIKPNAETHPRGRYIKFLMHSL